jgi:hypothetical protein
MTVVDYKGHRIEVCPVGKGWRASIFSPGSTASWPNSPANLEKSSTEGIVAEAKRIIEVRLGPRLSWNLPSRKPVSSEKFFQPGESAMPLRQGEVHGYDFNRMVVEFTMLNQDKVVKCAISTTAMDDLEGKRDVKPHQRVEQFMRLREVIEEQASRKFFDEQVGVDRPVVLRSNDFSIVASLRRPHHS